MVAAAEEGRGKRRNAPGSRKQALIRGCPNGETRLASWPGIPGPIHKPGKGTWGTETSQYPEEEKANSDSPSSGERKGKSLNRLRVKLTGVAEAG